jgi:K+-sensing histidine kinase KdpD
MNTGQLTRLHMKNGEDIIPTQSTINQSIFSKRSSVKTFFTANYTPRFLPRPLRSLIVGYFTALLLQLLVAIVLILLIKVYPTFQFSESLALLAVLLVALAWGVGPSLLATLAGTAMLMFLALPPYFSLVITGMDNKVGVFLFVLVSLTVSLLASQTQHARSALEDEKESLRKSEQDAQGRAQQLEALFEAVTDGILVYDIDGRLQQTNTMARTMLTRYVAQEYFIQPIPDRAEQTNLHAPDGNAIALDQIPSVRILHGEVLTGANAADIVVRTFAGEDLWLNISGTPLRNEEGHITGALAIARDVTERRQLEQRTRHVLDALLQIAQVVVQGVTSDASSFDQEHSHLQAVMQRMGELMVAVLGCDRLGITRVEPETERLRPLAVVGLPPEQERQWWREQEKVDISLSDSSEPELVKRLRANEILIMDLTQPPYNEQPNPYGIRQMLVAPMVSSSQILGYLTLDYGGLDHTYTPEELALTRAVTELITLVMERERLLTEAAQARANELAAVSANQLKDEFIGIAGHELRTPITTMKANLQLSRRRLRKFFQHYSDEEVLQALQPLEQLLERAERQLERQNRLVHDLLDVSRLEQGHLELRIEKNDLVSIVQEAIEEQQQITPDRTLLVHVPPTAIYIEADGDRINQVISNYLSNALKYSESERPVEVLVEVREGVACVSVCDQGPGLSLDEQQHIWERFYRVPGIQVQSGSGVGLGLGLHISRIIIERQGGSVGIKSELGKGSTFWFSLPII